MDFKNKNILITGASRGIGKATALAFAKKGAKVGVNFKKNLEEAERTLASLPGKGHRLFQYDVSKKEDTKNLITNFTRAYGTLDILVNNAGIGAFQAIDKVDFDTWTESWADVLGTNLIAIANTCYWATQAMIRQGGGRIVNVSSRGAFRGEPVQPAYGASKAALNSLSQSLAKYLAPHKIYVGVVAPGFTDTDMATQALTKRERESLMRESPFLRMAKPEEVAHAILFLASEGAEYSTGTIIDVNGASYLR